MVTFGGANISLCLAAGRELLFAGTPAIGGKPAVPVAETERPGRPRRSATGFNAREVL